MRDRMIHLPPLVPRAISYLTGVIAAVAAVLALVEGVQEGWAVSIILSLLCYIVVLLLCVGMLRRNGWIAPRNGSVLIGRRSLIWQNRERNVPVGDVLGFTVADSSGNAVVVEMRTKEGGYVLLVTTSRKRAEALRATLHEMLAKHRKS